MNKDFLTLFSKRDIIGCTDLNNILQVTEKKMNVDKSQSVQEHEVGIYDSCLWKMSRLQQFMLL